MWNLVVESGVKWVIMVRNLENVAPTLLISYKISKFLKKFIANKVKNVYICIMEKNKKSYFFSISRSEMEYTIYKKFKGNHSVFFTNVSLGFRRMKENDMIMVDGKRRCTEFIYFQSRDQILEYLLRDDITPLDSRLYRIYFVIPQDVWVNYGDWINKVTPKDYGIIGVERHKFYTWGICRTHRQPTINPNFVIMDHDEIWDMMKNVRHEYWELQCELLHLRKAIKKHEKLQKKRYRKITSNDEYGGKYFTGEK